MEWQIRCGEKRREIGKNSATVVRMEKGDDCRGGGMSGSQLTMEASKPVYGRQCKSHADVRPYQRRMRLGWQIGLCRIRTSASPEIFIRRERAFCVDKRLRDDKIVSASGRGLLLQTERWLSGRKAPVLKTGDVKASVGSNPTLSASFITGLRKYPSGRRGSPAKGVDA